MPHVPFVWDIAFVEVFQDEKNGFDIVIGNPPYVRQEKIRDPLLPVDIASTPEAKKAYKAKLARSIYMRWPLTFGYNWSKGDAKWKLDAKSDLYIYFYFYGLSLLNPGGAFCFITSNSWLDVGYGKDLQEFLLTRGQVKLVIDNQNRRSFSSADVNTVIVLLGSTSDHKTEQKESLNATARFVMLKASYEHILSPIIWEEIENTSIRTRTPEFNLHPIKQEVLVSNGMDPVTNKFSGDKWGGKYLRAPDIYWEILEKNKDKYVKLKQVLNYSYGIKPGSVDFFYLSKEEVNDWGIEKDFIRPIITSSQSMTRIKVNPDSYFFYCKASKKDLVNTNALRYILRGEQQGINNIQSVKAHTPFWYSISGEPFEILLLQFYDKRFWTPIADSEIYCSNNFFYGKTAKEIYRDKLPALLNMTFHYLQICIIGRANQGQGVLTTYGPDFDQMIIIKPELIDQNITDLLNPLLNRDVLSIFEEVEMNDRKELDRVYFEALKLTNGEQEAVYESIVNLVKARIDKAGSLSGHRVAKQLTDLEW